MNKSRLLISTMAGLLLIGSVSLAAHNPTQYIAFSGTPNLGTKVVTLTLTSKTSVACPHTLQINSTSHEISPIAIVPRHTLRCTYNLVDSPSPASQAIVKQGTIILGYKPNARDKTDTYLIDKAAHGASILAHRGMDGNIKFTSYKG